MCVRALERKSTAVLRAAAVARGSSARRRRTPRARPPHPVAVVHRTTPRPPACSPSPRLSLSPPEARGEQTGWGLGRGGEARGSVAPPLGRGIARDALHPPPPSEHKNRLRRGTNASRTHNATHTNTILRHLANRTHTHESPRERAERLVAGESARESAVGRGRSCSPSLSSLLRLPLPARVRLKKGTSQAQKLDALVAPLPRLSRVAAARARVLEQKPFSRRLSSGF